MSFLANHASASSFVILVVLYSICAYISKNALKRIIGIFLYINILYFIAVFCSVSFQELYNQYIKDYIQPFSFDKDTCFYTIACIIIIACVSFTVFHPKRTEAAGDLPQMTCDERLQEAGEAFKTLTNDYSSLLKFLITLSSSSIVFSGSFLEKNAIPPTIKFSWLCWSGCIVLSLLSLGLSIYNQNKHIEQLTDLNIATNDLKQPSNEGEYTCTALAGITFAIAFLFFTSSIWTNTPKHQDQAKAPKDAALAQQTSPFWNS